MSFLESCCDNQNSSKVLLFVGIDVISRLRLCQLLHTPPFLLEPLHVDPVLLHHIVQRVIVQDVWRGSGLHVRIEKQTMVRESPLGNSNQSNCQFFLSIHRRNKAPSRCLWLDRLVGRKLPRSKLPGNFRLENRCQARPPQHRTDSPTNRNIWDFR